MCRAETLRAPRQGPGKRRDRGEEWDGVNRASWRLTIKDQGSTDVMQLSSTYRIIIRMNCGKHFHAIEKQSSYKTMRSAYTGR